MRQEEQSVLREEQPDEETFRRVWARVMAGREESAITVNAPQTRSNSAAEVQPMETPISRDQVARQSEGEREKILTPQREDQVPIAPQKAENSSATVAMEVPEEWLRQLMDLAREGVSAGQILARRMGGKGRMLGELTTDHRTALRRLGAAYFLQTGLRYIAPNPKLTRNGPLDQALREQFLWEGRWEEACRSAAEKLSEVAECELCQELAQDAALHRRAIRRLLEQM
ncbi:MAG: hypothetical protein ACOX7N_00080 [Lawsonibacter sp.]|jgi:hypothetical protein